jgi:hypothetical protein
MILNPNITANLPAVGGSPFNILSAYNPRLVTQEAILTVNGINDIYTVPAGKKFIIDHIVRMNPTGGAITSSQAVRRSGADYRLDVPNSQSLASPVASANAVVSGRGVVLEAGEIIRVTTNGINLRFFVCGILIDSSAPIQTYWVNNTSTTPQTLFTVPAGKKLIPLLGGGTYDLQFSTNVNPLVLNNAGGSPTLTFHYIEEGASTGATKVIGTLAPTDNAAVGSSVIAPMIYNSGDSMTVTSSINTTGTHVRLTGLLVDEIS